MPELPEVDTVIEPQIVGLTIEKITLNRPEIIAHPTADEFCSAATGLVISKRQIHYLPLCCFLLLLLAGGAIYAASASNYGAHKYFAAMRAGLSGVIIHLQIRRVAVVFIRFLLCILRPKPTWNQEWVLSFGRARLKSSRFVSMKILKQCFLCWHKASIERKHTQWRQSS